MISYFTLLARNQSNPCVYNITQIPEKFEFFPFFVDGKRNRRQRRPAITAAASLSLPSA
jgi:hypothetical protein